MLHGFEQFLALGGGQPDVGGQSRLLEQAGNPFHIALREAEQFRRKPGGKHLADGDGFAVQKFAVAADRFQRVAEGVAEVEDGAQPALGFVLAHDAGLDLAAARHD